MATIIESGNWNKMPWKPVREGMKQVTFAMGCDDCTVTIGMLNKGHEVRPHSHPEDQITICLEGECNYEVDGVPHHLTPGSWITVPGGVKHFIEVKDTDIPCICIDIFHQPRPDFKENYVKYLKEIGYELPEFLK